MSKTIDRAGWGHPEPGRPGGHDIDWKTVDEAIVHHSYRPHLPDGVSEAEACEAVYGIWDYHVNTHGWDDIGYQWLVDPEGRIYEGRGWGRTGAHTEGRNSKSIGVCILIDGDQVEPTDEAWEACRGVIRDGIELGYIAEDYSVSGHTDYARKSCPGDEVYPKLDRLYDLEGNNVSKLSEDDQEWLAEFVAEGRERDANPASLWHPLDWLRVVRDQFFNRYFQ